jgi:hypothetical protein
MAWGRSRRSGLSPTQRKGPMDQPTDPLARQLALTALTTEQFNLQTARMGPSRGQRPLHPVPGHLVQRGHRPRLRRPSQPARRQLLPVRTAAATAGVPAGGVQLSATGPDLDRGYGLCRGTFRIRQYFLGLDPAAVPLPGPALPASRGGGARAIRRAKPGPAWVADRVTRPHSQPLSRDIDTGRTSSVHSTGAFPAAPPTR